MKLKLLTVVLIAITSYSLAAAQSEIDNCCFLGWQCNSNQDWADGYWAYQNNQCSAQPPTQSSTAPAGVAPAQVDNCCYVDRQCNSNQDWADGYWAYQRNECPPGGAPATQAPVSLPANVDNCCFVNRQCNTEAEWAAGYWAYQNNQCGAQSAASTSPASSALPGLPLTRSTVRLSSFNFDNCCYMDPDAWRCQNEADWSRGYWEFQNHVCLHPLPIGTRPATVGNAKFHKLVNDALELIRNHAPEWLTYIDSSGTHKFEARPGQRGGFYNEEWTVAHGWYQWENDDPNWHPDYNYVVGYAGGITHEACHAMQQRTHTHTLESWRDEKECTEAQLTVIEAINPNSPDIGWLRDTIANIENPEYWWW